MNQIILIISFTLLSTILSAQRYLSASFHQERIAVNVSAPEGCTMYGLSKASGIDISELRTINNKPNNSLSLNETLIVPLVSDKISISKRGLQHPIPIYYQVNTGDNLYRIAKKVGHTSMQLIELNAKTDERLAQQEELLLGWVNWPYGEAHEITPQVVEDVVASINIPSVTSRKGDHITPSLQSYISQISNDEADMVIAIPDYVETSYDYKRSIVKEKGIAFWEKSRYQTKEMIVMHPYARVDSKISLYNPMLKRKVEAKVVSELPKEAYPEDISVVISPSVADALGALDRRFQVEITYVQ